MTNVHQRALANKLGISFVNLEEMVYALDNSDSTKVKVLVLQVRGQIMHEGEGAPKATIFTRYRESHFDLLEVCQGNDADVTHVWDLEAERTYFQLVRMPKDHACGWSCTARKLNEARVPVPAAMQKPPASDE